MQITRVTFVGLWAREWLSSNTRPDDGKDPENEIEKKKEQIILARNKRIC